MRLILSLILFLSLNLAWAQPQIPVLTSPVMDLAGFLSPTEQKDLADLAYEIYANQGPQVTVLTVPDLQGHPIEEFSIRVAEKWQLGTKKEGNGLLIIISKAERQVRIEVGEGIEGEITDYESNQYINQILVPSFKAQDFHGGLRTVIEDIAAKFNIKVGTESKIIKRAPVRQVGVLGKLFPFLAIAIVLIHLLFRKRPVLRGLFTGVGFAAVGYLFGIGLGILTLFILGLVLGITGINNILYALASGQGGGGRYRGGGGGFGGGSFGGGGGWSGGGGGFSGGGSSGRW